MGQQIELKKQGMAKKIADEHKALMKDIIKANKNLADRAKRYGFIFDLDSDADVLTITIGDSSANTYTQGLDDVYADFDLETNEVASFTILEFERAFLKSKEGRRVFSDNLVVPVLRKYGTLSFPPEREGTRVAARELRTLVPA